MGSFMYQHKPNQLQLCLNFYFSYWETYLKTYEFYITVLSALLTVKPLLLPYGELILPEDMKLSFQA